LLPALTSAHEHWGRLVLQRHDAQSGIAPNWFALLHELVDVGLLRERYGELVRDQRDLRRTMVEADIVITIAGALRETNAFEQWSSNPSETTAFANRLRDDLPFRQELADAVGFPIEGLLGKMAVALDEHTRAFNALADRSFIATLGSTPDVEPTHSWRPLN
jgi:hypothetical protein